jgi:protein TonB
MLVVIGVHVALLAVVMSAKMDIPRLHGQPPLVIDTIKPLPVPPPNPTRDPATPRSSTWLSNPVHHEVVPPIQQPQVVTSQNPVGPGPILGAGTSVTPEIPHTIVASVKSGPQLLTPASELKPPYPASKLLNEEEATLTLRLSIDPGGRVTAVQPVGRNDPVFLEAARRYLIAHWRYKPATDDGQAVGSSAVITLRFQLDG